METQINKPCFSANYFRNLYVRFTKAYERGYTYENSAFIRSSIVNKSNELVRGYCRNWEKRRIRRFLTKWDIDECLRQKLKYMFTQAHYNILTHSLHVLIPVGVCII